MVLLGAQLDRIKKVASKFRNQRKCPSTSKQHIAVDAAASTSAAQQSSGFGPVTNSYSKSPTQAAGHGASYSISSLCNPPNAPAGDHGFVPLASVTDTKPALIHAAAPPPLPPPQLPANTTQTFHSPSASLTMNDAPPGPGAFPMGYPCLNGSATMDAPYALAQLGQPPVVTLGTPVLPSRVTLGTPVLPSRDALSRPSTSRDSSMDGESSTRSDPAAPVDFMNPTTNSFSYQHPSFDQWWAEALLESSGSVFSREPARSTHPQTASQSAAASGEHVMLAMCRKISKFRCHLCDRSFDLGPADVIANMRTMTHTNGNVGPWYKCRQCAVSNCLGCGVGVVSLTESRTQSFDRRPSLAWCCDIGHLFLVWALCCGIECRDPYAARRPAAVAPDMGVGGKSPFSFLKTPATSASTKGHHPKSSSTKSSSSKGSSSKAGPSKGYPKGYPNMASIAHFAGKSPFGKKTAKSAVPNGVGYGDSMDFPPHMLSSHSMYLSAQMLSSNSAYAFASESSSMRDDTMYSDYYLTLSRLLSSSTGGGGGGGGAPDRTTSPAATNAICQFLWRSPLLSKAAELLRNASIENITKRFDLYDILCRFLTVLCDDATLSGVVTQPRPVFAEYEMLPGICFVSHGNTVAAQEADARKFKEKGHEHSEPLAAILKQTADLCSRVLQQAATFPREFASEDGPKTLDICRKFSDLNRRVVDLQAHPSATTTQNASNPPSAPRPPRRTRNTTMMEGERAKAERAAAWHSQNCLADVDDDAVMEGHTYQHAMKSVKDPLRGRMKRLISDINMLRTSLPEGIFVRHGSSRLDAIKVLIVGPKGTPYENGLFAFDMFCPSTFPQVPPNMHLQTTGRGQVRFNPNLYSDGTVCLSLLGTWGQGEKWHPEHSTLLQVLVSIQAMVFCEEPYYNEPGRESRMEPAASARENLTLQHCTIRHAILSWLYDLPREEGSRSTKRTCSCDMAVWKDVVREHFALNGRAILKMAQGLIGGATDREMVAELAAALQEHSFLTA